VKAPDFEYVRVSTLAEALKQLDTSDDVRLLAGGQSLLPSLNLRLSQPQKLIDISRIKGLSGITKGRGIIKIGALTRHCEIEASHLIREQLPLLSMAVHHIAHPAIRNRGTIGGSLALADPAAEWPACCMALDAIIVTTSSRGEKRIAAADFVQGLYATVLEPDEMITSVEIPVSDKGAVAGFSELARRHGDYALVGLAAQGTLLNGRWSKVKLVFFGVSDRPIFAAEAAEKLIEGRGVKAAQDCIDSALDFSGDDVCSAETRLHLARVLLGRVITTMESKIQ
jgi:aerobic carbon-monoxide dehydrogenase medium subunit